MHANFTFHDPPLMPGSCLPPSEVYFNAVSLTGTLGQAYVERRGISPDIAASLGVRFDPSFGGRPAVVVALRDREGTLTSVHGRYLHTSRGKSKMLTVGTVGGAICLHGAWETPPLILVEGLFDALSLAVCGWQAIATIGRPVPWLAEVAAGGTVWAAFDNGRSGELNAQSCRSRLAAAEVRRLPPPERCKDWNTALVKLGARSVSKWVRDRVTA
jgi:hypothetical protein